ncbi:MAG: hypothetical protein AB1938_01970 [Myxococcota bacterium]
MRSWLVTLAFFLASCGAIRFEVEQAISEQRVPGSPLGGILPDFFPNPFRLTIDVKAETEKRGTGPATAAFLKSLTLNATPAGNPSGTFDFLDEVHVFVEAPGLSRVEVATLKPVPKGQTSVSFTIVPDVNLLPYVNAGATMSTTATGTQPARDFTFDGKAVFEVRI